MDFIEGKEEVKMKVLRELLHVHPDRPDNSFAESFVGTMRAIVLGALAGGLLISVAGIVTSL